MVFGCAVLGAPAMYILAPVRGRRRRAIARDKLRSVVADTGGMMVKAAHDARFRMHGLQSQAHRMTHRGDIPDVWCTRRCAASQDGIRRQPPSTRSIAASRLGQSFWYLMGLTAWTFRCSDLIDPAFFGVPGPPNTYSWTRRS